MKTAKEKSLIKYKCALIRQSADSSQKPYRPGKSEIIYQNAQGRKLVIKGPAKLSFRNEGELTAFLNKLKLRESPIDLPYKKILRGLQAEMKGH